MSLHDQIADHEWLEQGHLRADEVRANLRDLALINRWLGGSRSVIPHVMRAMSAAPARGPFRVLDIACGGGDLLRLVVTQARRLGRAVRGVGVDANGQVLAYAREASADCPELRWVQADALALPFPPSSFDLVMSSCFLHHLEPAEASRLLTQAAALSRRSVVAGDLVSSLTGAAAFRLFGRLARLHPVTRHDGVLSLRRAYRPHALTEIARAAGLAGWQLHRHAFCRATLVCDLT